MSGYKFLLEGTKHPQGARGPLRLHDDHTYSVRPIRNKDELTDLMVEVADRIVRTTGSRLDLQGFFYTKSPPTKAKVRVPNCPSMGRVLDDLQKLGVEVPVGYWATNAGNVMERVNHPEVLA